MKLNVDILIDNLSDTFQVEAYGHRNSDMKLSRPVFYNGSSIFDAYNVYVAPADLLPEHPVINNNTVIICFGGKL